MNAFDLCRGFTLTVKWRGSDSVNGDSFGLSSTQITRTTAGNDWLGWGGVGGHRDLPRISVKHAFYGIGFVFARNDDIADPFDKGLKFSNGSGAAGEGGRGQVVQLSNPPIPFHGVNTLVLTVKGDWYSYSLNGAASISGEIVAGRGLFDMSRPFYFNAYSQAGVTTIIEVKVEAVDEVPPESVTLGLIVD